jgi:hypothetical protein
MSCSFFTNYRLFARIFCSKFDIDAPLRRRMVGNTPKRALAMELRRRCAMMTRMRLANYSQSIDVTCSDADEHTILWGVYIMCIESDGKNLRQLREYAGIEGYLSLYMDSVLIRAHSRPGFTLETTDKSLALWIMLFLSAPTL